MIFNRQWCLEIFSCFAKLIIRNHFHDFVGVKGENVHEPLQLGQGLNRADIALGALVERNLSGKRHAS